VTPKPFVPQGRSCRRKGKVRKVEEEDGGTKKWSITLVKTVTRMTSSPTEREEISGKDTGREGKVTLKNRWGDGNSSTNQNQQRWRYKGVSNLGRLQISLKKKRGVRKDNVNGTDRLRATSEGG